MGTLTLPISETVWRKFSFDFDKLREELEKEGLSELVEGVDYFWNRTIHKVNSITFTNPDFRKGFMKTLLLK